MLARCLVGVLLIIATCTGSAAAGSFGLSGNAPVGFDGALEVTTHVGMADTFVRTTTPAVFENVTGRFTISEWNQTSIAEQSGSREDVRSRQYHLSDARVRVEPAGETRLIAEARGGNVSVAGDWRGAGVAHALRVAYAPTVGASANTPPRLDLRYDAGWLLAGAIATGENGLPARGLASLRLAGDVAFTLEGPMWVNFTDADGTTQRIRLGVETTSIASSHLRMLLFEGNIGGGAYPLANWSLAGPDLTYALDAQVTWDRATGTVTSDGRESTVTNAAVQMRFDGAAIASPTSIASWSWVGAGEVSDLVINGRPVARQTTTLASPEGVAASVTGAAFILLLLSKLGQSLIAAGAAALYTRLTPGTALDHPRRREIRDIVAREPGIHQRALHREVGGAWGPFTFHLRTLERLGHLRVVREGGYSCVFPADVERTPPIPHELARRLFEAIPLDGSPIPLTETAGQLGVSRELANYHANSLEARGLVRRVELSGARRGIARVVDHAADAA